MSCVVTMSMKMSDNEVVLCMSWTWSWAWRRDSVARVEFRTLDYVYENRILGCDIEPWSLGNFVHPALLQFS